MNDEKIIEQVKNGDSSAFADLVLQYQDKVYTLCRYMLENPQDAEDATQDTFLKAYRNIKDYIPSASFYTWLYRIAVNTCLDHKRKLTFHSLFFPGADKENHIDSLPSLSHSPETAYATKQSLQALQLALNRISKKLRIVIILKEIEGLSYEEIAAVLDVSIGTVKSRISRAREELNKIVKHDPSAFERL